MTNLFFDIETVPNYNSREDYLSIKEKIQRGIISKEINKNLFWKFDKGALNPHEGKIIAITYKIDNSDIVILEEWNSSEKDILQNFFNLIDTLSREGWQKNDPLSLVGLNIVSFDLPFLYERMKQNVIITSSYTGHDPIWLYKKLFAFPIDLFQAHLHLNDFDGKGLKHNIICTAYNLNNKNKQGNELTDDYYLERYEEIEKYINEEFVYSELFEKIKNKGLTTKEKIKELIKKQENANL